jgi:hypothetical protein
MVLKGGLVVTTLQTEASAVAVVVEEEENVPVDEDSADDGDGVLS